MDFNLLTEQELKGILYLNNGHQIPSGSKIDLANQASEQYVRSSQNNFQGYVMHPSVIALDRSVRYPQSYTRRYSEEQIMSMGVDDVKTFSQIFNLDSSYDYVKSIIYRIIGLQGGLYKYISGTGDIFFNSPVQYPGQIRVGRIQGNSKPKMSGFKPVEIMMRSSKYYSLSPYSLKDEKGRIMENIFLILKKILIFYLLKK